MRVLSPEESAPTAEALEAMNEELLGKLTLDADRGLHRHDGARKLRQHTVAGGAYHPPTMLGDKPGHHASIVVEQRQRPSLVHPHQTAVAEDVSREDIRQLALDLSAHACAASNNLMWPVPQEAGRSEFS